MMHFQPNRSDDRQIRAMGAQIPGFLEEASVPGLSLVVIRDGGIIGPLTFGIKDRVTESPVDSRTVFQGASLSKPIFTIAALRLWETGRLDLDVPLRAYLPSSYEPQDPRIDQITARMVLCHTTGLPNWRPDGGALRTLSPPGARFGYSGEGFVYLQQVVEHLTGESLDRHVRRVVLDPLGMTSTNYVWSDTYDATIATGHRVDGTAYAIDRPDTANAAFSVHTTPQDVARLLLALVAPRADRVILQPATVAAMLRPQVPVPQNAALSWALSWGVQQTVAGTAIWHWGANPGFRHVVIAYPQQQSGIVVMTNGDNGLMVCEQILKEIVGGEYPFFRVIHRPMLGLEHRPAIGEDRL